MEIKPYEDIWVIRFMDGSHITVNEKQGKQLLEQSAHAETFVIRNIMRRFSSVTFLGPKAEYYIQYPEEAPVSYGQPYSEKGYTGIIDLADTGTPDKRIKNLRVFYEGMKRTANPQNPLLVLAGRRLAKAIAEYET
jgi:hypothetical protein